MHVQNHMTVILRIRGLVFFSLAQESLSKTLKLDQVQCSNFFSTWRTNRQYIHTYIIPKQNCTVLLYRPPSSANPHELLTVMRAFFTEGLWLHKKEVVPGCREHTHGGRCFQTHSVRSCQLRRTADVPGAAHGHSGMPKKYQQVVIFHLCGPYSFPHRKKKSASLCKEHTG